MLNKKKIQKAAKAHINIMPKISKKKITAKCKDGIM